MLFLCNNAAAFAAAILASVSVWVFGGMHGELLTAYAPWLLIFMLEIMICFPQRHKYETTMDARERVWHAMKKDPAVWISLGFMALMMVPFINNGLCRSCDALAVAEGLDPEPPVSVLPFCVNRIDHLHVVEWFAVALTLMVAVRHCLTRRGKRLILKLIVWNGVALAVLGFVQQALDAPGPLWWSWEKVSLWPVPFFSTFGYVNTAGDYFTVLFGIAVALWRDNCEQIRKERMNKDLSSAAKKPHLQFWRKHYFLIPSALFYFAALNTLSRTAIILATASAVIYFIHTLFVIISRMKKAKRVIVGVWSIVGLLVILFFSSMFMPDKLNKEINTLRSDTTLNRVTGKKDVHSRIATEIWREHLLFGCGGWGYRHLCAEKMPEKDRKKLDIMAGSINVHNDYLQFLAEHGLVGLGSIIAIVVVIMYPIVMTWRRLIRELSFKKNGTLPPKPIQIFALPAPVFIILITASVTLVHGFWDCPFRSVAILSLFFIELAALPGFMPKLQEE